MLHGQVCHILRNSEQKYKEAIVGDVLDPTIRHHPLDAKRCTRSLSATCDRLIVSCVNMHAGVRSANHHMPRVSG